MRKRYRYGLFVFKPLLPAYLFPLGYTRVRSGHYFMVTMENGYRKHWKVISESQLTEFHVIWSD